MLRRHVDVIALIVVTLVFLAAGRAGSVRVVRAASVPVEVRGIAESLKSFGDVKVCPLTLLFK